MSIFFGPKTSPKRVFREAHRRQGARASQVKSITSSKPQTQRATHSIRQRAKLLSTLQKISLPLLVNIHVNGLLCNYFELSETPSASKIRLGEPSHVLNNVMENIHVTGHPVDAVPNWKGSYLQFHIAILQQDCIHTSIRQLRCRNIGCSAVTAPHLNILHEALPKELRHHVRETALRRIVKISASRLGT